MDHLNWVHNIICDCLLQSLLSDCVARTATASTTVPQPPVTCAARTVTASTLVPQTPVTSTCTHRQFIIRPVSCKNLTSPQTNAISHSLKNFELPNSHHQSVIYTKVYGETGIFFERKYRFKYTRSRYIKASAIFLARVTLFEWHIHETRRTTYTVAVFVYTRQR